MDIGGWLRKLGLEQYEASFRENKIDDMVLPSLTVEDLKDLGVEFVGDRRKLLNAIAALKPEASAPPAALSDTSPAIGKGTSDTAERRQVTVMFSDLVGSTALSGRMDPEDLREVISAYQKCVAETVGRFGGFVAKYMGDGVLVYFGYPRAHENDAEHAVRAALALVEAVPKLATKAGSPLLVRVGISTGLVVVGDLIGAGAAREQAVVGETPNLAARLQAAAAPGTVVIGPTTRRLLAGLFEYHDLGGIEAKGFAAPVQAYQVVRPSTVESRFEALRAATTPLVGRDEEIELLLRRWAQAKHGEGQVVLISGEPGIGKSRVAQTVADRISAEPHTRLRYFCSPHHQNSALHPSIGQLERAAGFRRDDTGEQRLAKLEGMLTQGTNDLSEAVPLLADLLSIPTGDRYPSLNVSPQKRKEKTLRAQLAHVEGLATQQPVLMVWEDVHWSDPTSRELLDLLVDRVPTLPVLVIITFRPEFAPSWRGRPQVTILTLNRLPPRHRAQMIAYVTGGKTLPREIADQIVDRTDGVPLFIEELTKTVVESGALTDTGDRYTVTGSVAPLAIPTTLHASLLARLDRLAPTREVAQIASALGRQFSHELISAVAKMPQDKVDDALAQLTRAELIFQRGTLPDAVYTFKHALVQDAAYSTLLHSQRRQLHAQIAATLEERFPEIAAAQPQLMAYHFSEAGLNEAAVDYYLKAGRQSVARSVMTEAVAQLRKGLDLLTRLPNGTPRQQKELDLQITLGRALMAASGMAAPEMGETYIRARSLAERLNYTDYPIPLLFGQFIFHNVRAEHRLALTVTDHIQRLGEAQSDVAVELLGRHLTGILRLFLGEFTTARDLLEQCRAGNFRAHRAIYANVTADDPAAVMLGQLGLTLAYLGHFDQARARINDALSETRELAHSYTLGHVLLDACNWQWVCGSPIGAEKYAAEVTALTDEQDFPVWLGFALLHHGWSLVLTGSMEEGLTLLRKGLSTVRATGAVIGTPWALMMLADAHRRLGQLGESFNCLVEAAQIIEFTDERYEEAELHRLHGDLRSTTGDCAMAEQHYRQALAVAQHQSAKALELRAATSLARFWCDQGRRIEARDLLAPIYGWFTEGFETPVLQKAKVLLDQLHA